MIDTVYYDEYGNAYTLDDQGNKRPVMQVEPIKSSSAFTTFPTDQGHCGLCGRLTCSGGCFK